MSSSFVDNSASSTSASLGRTFVFAYGDGSGIQLNHISFNSGPPTSNSTAGAGTNTLTSAPSTYSYSSPTMVSENYCFTTVLELVGTTDTSGLSSTITTYSDGYKAVLALNLEMILTGAQGGWRGVCIVKFSSQYMQDNTNGALCVSATQSTTAGHGPTDLGSVNL